MATRIDTATPWHLSRCGLVEFEKSFVNGVVDVVDVELNIIEKLVQAYAEDFFDIGVVKSGAETPKFLFDGVVEWSNFSCSTGPSPVPFNIASWKRSIP